jgi:hypothetical protein
LKLIHSAIPIEIAVANEADPILTILFHIRIAINTLSFSFLQYFKYFAQRLCCFTNVSTLCCGIDVNAVSLPEKNIESRIKIMKLTIENGSIL